MANRADKEAAASTSAATATSAPAPAAAAGGSSLRNFLLLVAHQLMTRIGTFGFNIIVARLIGPASYGLSAVHLYLLNSMILFLSREAIRRSTLRYAAPAGLSPLHASRHERIVLVNLSWLSIVAAIPLCILFCAAFLQFAPEFSSAALQAEYRSCILLYTLASWLELVSEPLYLLFQKAQRVKERVIIDGAAVYVRCAVMFLSLKFGPTAGGILPFAYGQLAFALCLLVGYLSYCARDILRATLAKKDDAIATSIPSSAVLSRVRDLFPQRLPTPSDAPAASRDSRSRSLVSRYSDASLLRLTGQLQLQSVEKFALTEGEKLVIVALSNNLDAQGVYGLVQNLGSLVARMLLQPLEESAFIEFGTKFAGVTSEREKSEAEQRSSAQKLVEASAADSAATPSSSLALYQSGAGLLGVLIHVVLLLGLLLLSFGPSYSYVLIDLLYGVSWSSTDAPTVLSAYCIYILVMAINGVTEAFVSAVISTRQLRNYNLCLILFSVLYLVACALLLPFGPIGLIAANCVNMAMRILYSALFTRTFFAQAGSSEKRQVDGAQSGESDSPLAHLTRSMWPSRATVAVCAASFCLTQLSASMLAITSTHSLLRFAAHIAVGVTCLLLLAVTVWRKEAHSLQHVRHTMAARRRAKSN